MTEKAKNSERIDELERLVDSQAENIQNLTSQVGALQKLVKEQTALLLEVRQSCSLGN